MINNLTPEQLGDIRHLFYYFSGRRTTLEEELKQVDRVDITKRIEPNSNKDQHLLMKAVYEFSKHFVGHGFFYIPVEESDIDSILNLAFAGLHPKRYVPNFEVDGVNAEQIDDLYSMIQSHLGTIVESLNGKSETIKLGDSHITISYERERMPNTMGELFLIPANLCKHRLKPKDNEGYSRLKIVVSVPHDFISNLGEIEDVVYKHLQGLMQFTYEKSGLLEKFPVLKGYVQKEDEVIETSINLHFDHSKFIPSSPCNLYFNVSFSDVCYLFRLTEVEVRFGRRETSTEPIPKDFLFNSCAEAYFGRVGFQKDELSYFFQVLPTVICDQIEDIFRRNYPKAITELEIEAEKEDNSDDLKVRRYCQLVSLYALSNLDKAYECLTKAVRWDQEHGHNFEFAEWNGGFKTIK
ncbi:hypothetical protein HY636_04130 [Candidatus Woesearchaeota archaeon]|nr:hypothetical protein [Nitrosarchaeum sp.]MBI4453806.1 hypothetical protein [Candidatus Woesearchaeota archaeon]